MTSLQTYPTTIKGAVEEYYAANPKGKLTDAAETLGLSYNQVRIARHALTRNGVIPPLQPSARKPNSRVARVEEFYLQNPWATHAEAAEALGITEKQVRKTRFRRAVVREKAPLT